MAVKVHWLGHASFIIEGESGRVAIDPWKVSRGDGPVDLVLVSHSHYDHYSPEDITLISGPETVVCGPADVQPDVRLAPEESRSFGGITVTGVRAYNIRKGFHPKANDWLGFVAALDGKRLYYAGDTDRIPEMKELGPLDLAMVPVGGTYTMDAVQAAAAVNAMECRLAVPYHWGDIVGELRDAERFAELCRCPVRVLQPSETLSL